MILYFIFLIGALKCFEWLYRNFKMTTKNFNEYISVPKFITEISLDKDGCILQHKTANKCYLYEKFINQDFFRINLQSSQISFEDKAKEMELNLRKNILQNLTKFGKTLKDSLYGVDFYCSSGILTKFATSHLQHSLINVWCIKIDGVIIMVDSNNLEKQPPAKENITLSSSDRENVTKKNPYISNSFNYDKILKYVAFFKKNSVNNKLVFTEGVQAWKQYRRVYLVDLKNPNVSKDNEPIRIVYNSIIHCVDKETDKPVIFKIRPSSIQEDNFLWRPNQLSKLYMQTVLLGSNKIVVGERDKDFVIHQTKIKTSNEIFEKNNLEEGTLYENLWFVMTRVKYTFDVNSTKPVKYVHIVKKNVKDEFHVTCFANPPEEELCIKVFDDF